MNKFLKIFFLVAVLGLVVNCNNDDAPSAEPEVLRDFQTQYNEDNLKIEDYLKSNKVTVDSDFNAVFTAVTKNDPTCMFIENQNNSSNPTKLLLRIVNSSGVDYKIYYLQLNKGGGARPTSADSVLTSYAGNVIEDSVIFDSNPDKENVFLLPGLIRAWSEIIPQFNGAVITTNNNGGKDYSNFGSGVMFVPSGFGYFNQSNVNNITKVTIPKYATLIFKFKLNGVIREDSDRDGILSIDEDLNGDYYFDTTNDDTDKDGIVDAVDQDDDNDNYLTIFEIKKPDRSPGSANYLFNDIPDCAKNTTNPTRLKRHLDKNCHD